jgi:hypothetical protein
MTDSLSGQAPASPCVGRQGWGRRDLALALLVGLAGLAVRVIYASTIVGPPTDDPAYYVTVARNLYEGHGFTSNVIWQHGLPFASPTHPAGEFWMPLASWLIYGAYVITGVSWPAAQAPGVLMGSGLAVLTYAIAWRLFAGMAGQRGLATAAGLLVAFNGVLAYQSVRAPLPCGSPVATSARSPWGPRGLAGARSSGRRSAGCVLAWHTWRGAMGSMWSWPWLP